MTQEMLIADHEAEQIVNDLGVPPCPEILTKLLREMREDEPDYIKISNLISADVSLAAAMLKTVNSPFFGLRTKATSVQQSLTLLGLRNVVEIVSGLLLRNALPTGNSKALEHFWETSSGIAQTASMLARPLAKLDREDAYTFALFRDCGIPLMASRYPDYEDFYLNADRRPEGFTAVEQTLFGMDHARIGAALARTWHLPDDTCMAISLHHEYGGSSLGEAPPAVAKLVALALTAEYVHARCAGGGACGEWSKGGAFALAALDITEDAIEEQVQLVEGVLGM